jgi:threonine dehydrogenase-like Zn-dependent dehydrogenase
MMRLSFPEVCMRISQVIGPRTSEIIEIADPVPAGHEVLVEVLACGACTSDLAPWRAGQLPGAPGTPGVRPFRLGHEVAGRVVATGSRVRGWQPGDLVTGLGDRGFASLTVLEAAHILPVPAGIEPALAIGEPVADLQEALSRTPAGPGQRIAVVGLGFMGLGLVQLARDLAPALLIGVDPLPAARQRALELGADLVLAPDELPAELGGPGTGELGRAGDGRADVVLEATGVTPGLAVAGTLVRPYGTLCVVGYHYAGDAMMDMGLWYKAVTIVNGFCPDRTRLVRAMGDALALIAAHRFSYAPLVTHRFGLDGVDQAYELMDARADGFVKAVLEP